MTSRYITCHPLRDDTCGALYCPHNPDVDPADVGRTWEEHCDNCRDLYERQQELFADAGRDEA